jgi:hypothetical protein
MARSFCISPLWIRRSHSLLLIHRWIAQGRCAYILDGLSRLVFEFLRRCAALFLCHQEGRLSNLFLFGFLRQRGLRPFHLFKL